MDKEVIKKIKVFVMRKRIMIPLVLVIAIAFYAFSGKNETSKISVVRVTVGDLSQTVKATGQVTSSTDLSLSFNKTGIVKSVKVAVGDKVKKGQILATLDQASEIAAITQAQGMLASAKAKMSRVKEGATGEEVNLARVALTNAKRDYDNSKKSQEQAVKSAYEAMLNSTPEAIPSGSTSDYLPAPTVSGSYTLNKEGDIILNVYNASNSAYMNMSGVATGSVAVSTTIAQGLGNSGLSIKFPSSANFVGTTWVIHLPNTKASNYAANKNAYDQALKTQESVLSSAQSLVDSRTAELALKQAQARQSDIDQAQADIVSAEGGLQAAQARYEDTVIRAPEAGTITKVDVKYGEQSDVQKQAIVLQDIDNLYIEADINESNISTVALGQSVAVTFDAFGKEKKFNGTVAHIDPSSVTTDGVVNYKIKVSLQEKDGAIRPGMNSEITILALTKTNAISIPKAAVTTKDGVSTVHFVSNVEEKTYTDRIVKTGILGDGNRIEITEGLASGDSVAVISL